MVVVHHPFVSFGLLYITLVAILIQIDAGVILVASVAFFAPFTTYLLANRTRKALRRETADAAAKAEAAAAAAAAAHVEVTAKVEEVHELVNSEREKLTALLADRDSRIAALEALIGKG